MPSWASQIQMTNGDEEKTRLCFGTTEYADTSTICRICVYHDECQAIPLNKKIKRNKRIKPSEAIYSKKKVIDENGKTISNNI